MALTLIVHCQKNRGKVKTLLFSVTKKDFIQQTFSVGGHGGSGKDTSNSGVRLIHKDSGAVGEGRETRSNTQNRKIAFEKLVKTDKFQKWLKVETAKRMHQFVEETPEQIRERVNKMVDADIKEGRIKIETYS